MLKTGMNMNKGFYAHFLGIRPKRKDMGHRMTKKISRRKIHTGLINVLMYLVLTITAIFMLLPVIIMFTNSLMSPEEIRAGNTITVGAFKMFKLIPNMISGDQYYSTLVHTPQFLIMFWNSCILTLPTVAGQIIISVLAGYGFAKFKFPFRDQLFAVFIITMLMPLVVTMVPNYMTAKFLGIQGDYSSVILPGVFSAFGVFLMRQYIKGIPDSFSEAARIDGAGELRLFFRIILPQCSNGVAALAILSFIDNWNMVEMPFIMLDDQMKQPLSVYLSFLYSNVNGIAYAASLLFALPVVLLFFVGEDYLVSGIEHSEL